MRNLARRLKLKAVRMLQGAALAVSSPFDFLNAVQIRLESPAMRHYLAEQGGADALIETIYRLTAEDEALRRHMASGGVDRLLGRLYDLAVADEKLRERIIRSEVGDVFRKLYPLAVNDPSSSAYLAERGIDDIYGYMRDLSVKIGTPLAQRAESFGQEGEDLLLTRFFDRQVTGFYVDVGAHHPFRFSNTWLLYCRGWRGINIDAMPGAMEAFRKWRPRDINIECVVSNDTRPRTFFQYDEPALNTLSEDLVRRREVDTPHYRVVRRTVLAARTLADIFAEHLPHGTAIDLLNVDVEGGDLEVLMSNDWELFRPRVVVAELIGTALADMQNSELYRFLDARGYRLQSKLVNSAIFMQGPDKCAS